MYELFWFGANLGTEDSLEEACVALYRNFKSTGYGLNEDEVRAWTADGSGIKKNGRWMSTLEMLYCGRRLSELWNSYEFVNSDRFRQGTVPGIRKWRGGGSYYRRIRTMAERRQNLGVVMEEGRTMVRGRRVNLPNSWDDIGRTRQRSWKSQFRGKKAWDRVA